MEEKRNYKTDDKETQPDFLEEPVVEYGVSQEQEVIGNKYILTPDEDLKRAITGEELLRRLIPRIENLFDK